MDSKNKKIVRNIFRVLLYVFALVGLFFVAIFFAMQFGWLNVKGSVRERNSYFNINNNENLQKSVDPGVVADWTNSEEWTLLRDVFTRDQAVPVCTWESG